jgi:hypothetical protein
MHITIPLPTQNRWLRGISLFNQILLDHPCDNPLTTAHNFRLLFNEVYGIMPDQARRLIRGYY